MTPTELNLLNTKDVVRSFTAGKESSYILFDNGNVGACGRNNVGQLGDDSTKDNSAATTKFPASARDVIYVGAGPSAESAFFITKGGEVYGTGLNKNGQLGVGNKNDRDAPTVVDFPNSANVREVSASDNHAIFW